MPTFEITAPDGRKFEVTGPEGSTKEQALAQVQARYKAPPAMNVDPTEGMSGTDKFFAGVGKGMTDVVRGVGQLTGLVDQQSIDEAKKRDAALLATGAGTAGNIVGNVAATAPLALVPGAGTLAGGTAIGAVAGLAAPVASDESRLQNAVFGAAGGAAGNLVSRGIARVAQPIKPTAAAKELIDAGIVPTAGQASGASSVINKVEQRLQSIPIIGDFISNARGRAVKEMNVEAIRKALPADKADEILTAGRPAIQRAGEIIDSAYDAVYAKIPGKVGLDDTFKNALAAVPAKEGIDLPPSLAERFNKLLEDRVFSRMENGASASSVRDINNSLGNLARKYRASGDPDQRALGVAFSEAKDQFRALVSRQTKGDFQQALKSLDGNYSALLAVEKAAERAGSKEGVFSGEAYKAAAKRASGSVKDFAQTSADVLGRTEPDSGTAARLLLPYLLGGGVAGANETFGGPGWITAAALAPLAYSRPGARYMLGDLAGQQAIAAGLRGTAPYAALIGSSLANK